jgi:serine/threonine protein kinase
MVGQTVSHYTILEKLGEGGMGVVFKATDTKLNRTVALKFLPDRVNKDGAAKARFLQEAQAAAGLNHPNICTIYGIDEHEGQLFMSMEYVEGGTLRERLPFSKTDDAIAIATQIGEALQEAHAKGIVHRDIKADNIMMSSKDSPS